MLFVSTTALFTDGLGKLKDVYVMFHIDAKEMSRCVRPQKVPDATVQTDLVVTGGSIGGAGGDRRDSDGFEGG